LPGRPGRRTAGGPSTVPGAVILERSLLTLEGDTAMEMQTSDRAATEAHEVQVIKEVCEKATEPAEIWDALDSKGINATPGVVYQAIQEHGAPGPEPTISLARKIPAEEAAGLTAEDLETVCALAEKAGGVDQLMRVLAVLQGAAR